LADADYGTSRHDCGFYYPALKWYNVENRWKKALPHVVATKRGHLPFQRRGSTPFLLDGETWNGVQYHSYFASDGGGNAVLRGMGLDLAVSLLEVYCTRRRARKCVCALRVFFLPSMHIFVVGVPASDGGTFKKNGLACMPCLHKCKDHYWPMYWYSKPFHAGQSFIHDQKLRVCLHAICTTIPILAHASLFYTRCFSSFFM
jgi:hypothetical protein